jgi:UDP-N-acetylglucosamine-lysosomal-enzyme
MLSELNLDIISIISDTMSEMQSKWSQEWIATSSHKFRSPEDMQYAFSYYYYVMNRHKAQPPSLLNYINNEIDTDHDGYLNSNEFLTLASVVAGKSPSGKMLFIDLLRL